MYYRDLIQFEPLESIVQLTSANDREYAFQLLDTYVISDRMAEQLDEILIEQLQLERFVDNKGIFIVGNYGTGKSHLMGVISTIAELPGSSERLSHSRVAKKAKEIEGKFKVIRIEIGATTMPLRDIICGELEDHLEEMGVDFKFPPLDQVRNNKDSLMEMMGAFKEVYPEHGLLLVVDELLDYLRARKQQELFLDLGFLREIGEICSRTHFRFIAGIQEMLFDNPKFQFVADQLRRVKERFEQVTIVREDVAFVVSNRLLKKDEKQKALIREHLQKFTKLYAKLNEEMEKYVELFPIHPAFLSTFERVAVAEKRVILKTISNEIRKLLDQKVPEDQPGLVSFDSYWAYIEGDSSLKSNPDIRQVIRVVNTLRDRIQHSDIKPIYRPLAERIVNALAVFRLTTDNIRTPIGLTSEQLRDDLFLNLPLLLDDDDPSGFLRTTIEATIREIMKAVSYQYISVNEHNGQYYFDIDKIIDFDALIRDKAEAMSEGELDTYFFELFAKVVEISRDPYTSGFRIWQYELPWYDRGVTRQGYLFFGAPNERSTAQPERDFYIYVLQPFDPPRFVDEKKPDEVFFKFEKKDPEFIDKLKLYAAAKELSLVAESSQKRTYEEKANTYLKYCTQWLIQHMPDAFKMTYQGQTKKLKDWSVFAHAKGSVKEIMDEAAADVLKGWFEEKYPDYPIFKVETPITRESLASYVADAIKQIPDPKSKSGKAILKGLVLLNKQEKTYPRDSGYARWVLELLNQKGPGQVVNRSELIETIYQHGTVTEELTAKFKMEPELLVVVLAALVYSGDLVITVDGTTYDAMKMDQLAKLPLNDLIQFSYIKKPSELPVREWEAIFEMVEVNPSLLRNSIEHGIAQVNANARALVNQVIDMQRQLSQGIETWEGKALTTPEDRNRLDGLKQFLESLDRFNTPAKAKNLRYSLVEIEEQKRALERLKELQSLKQKVQEWNEQANYLLQAKNVLPEEHPWQAGASEALNRLSHALTNGLDGRNELQRVKKLKEEYKSIYLQLHNQARLSATEEMKKQQLLQHPTYIALNQLATINILPAQSLEQWRNGVNALKTCYDLTKDKLEKNYLCPKCRYVPRTDTVKKVSLAYFEEELQHLLVHWTKLLIENLEADNVKENIDLLSKDQQDLIYTFLSRRELDLPLDSRFVKAVKELLQGIERIKIPMSKVIEMMGNGSPMTPAELRKRFEQLLYAYVGSRPESNVRIMVTKEEEY